MSVDLKDKLQLMIDVKETCAGLYEDMLFDEYQPLSTHAENLYEMLNNQGAVDERVNANWKGNLIRYTDTRMTRERYRELSGTGREFMLSSFLNGRPEDAIDLIKISNNFKYINGNILKKCTKLQKINAELTGIDNLNQLQNLEEFSSETFDLSARKSYAFYNCATLTSITLPATHTDLDDATFSGCRSLVSLDMPPIVKIGKNTFNNCQQFETLDVSELSAITGTGNFTATTKLFKSTPHLEMVNLRHAYDDQKH